jgi:CBS domain containing-hemolysin-like protein
LDEGSLSSLLILVSLIALHGAVELAYAAITNSRHTPLKEQSDKGDKQAKRILVGGRPAG